MSTGEIIKKLRIEKGYTQTELAIMLGLKLSTLQKYESGAIQNIKLETIRELCHIFEVPAFMLIFPERIMVPLHSQIKLTEAYDQEELFEFLRSIVCLNGTGRKKLLDHAKDLSEIPAYKANYCENITNNYKFR